MSYGFNPQYQQQYRPYSQQQMQWPQPGMSPNWTPQPQWQPPAEQPLPDPVIPENPIVLALRELTAEVSALRKSLNGVRKKESDDE